MTDEQVQAVRKALFAIQIKLLENFKFIQKDLADVRISLERVRTLIEAVKQDVKEISS